MEVELKNDIEMVILAFSENKWQHYVSLWKKTEDIKGNKVTSSI